MGTLIHDRPAEITPIASERTAQRVSEVIHQIEPQLDDRALLRRFVQDADEAAFEEIVRRYHKLVMSVCGRILGSGQDAEDAFQATFICLARRPRSIRHSKALSSWLYTVAYRTSWRLVRRRKKTPTEALETDPMSQSTDPLDKISDAQDCAIVDEELNRLPVKFKDVLVMTYFADQTSQQIADTLSVSKGTVDGRIRDAKNMLRVKLARRGVTIGAIALAASACTEATAAVSSTVLNSTLQLGSQTLASQALSTPDLSRINHLIRPETTMLSTKMIAATMLGIATAGAIGFSGIVAAQQGTPTNSQPSSLKATIDPFNGTSTDESDTTPAVVVNINKAFDGEELEDPFAAGVRPTAKNSSLPDPFGTPGKRSESTTSKLAQPTYSHIPKDASATEQRIYAALDRQTPALDFPGETDLEEVLGAIMEAVNQQSQPAQKITLVVDHKRLENEGLDNLDEIFLKDVKLSGIKLQTALKLILDQTELEYLIRDDVLFLTTEFEAFSNPDNYTTRVYPVKKLLAMQSSSESEKMGGGAFGGGPGDMGMGGHGGGMEGSGMGGGDYGDEYGGGLGGMGMEGGTGMSGGKIKSPSAKTQNKKLSPGGGLQSLPTQMGGNMGGGLGGGGLGGGGLQGDRYDLSPKESFVYLVQEMTSPPCLWLGIDGEGGAISLAGNSLVIRQSRRGHEEIVKLLNLLANAEE